MAPSTAYLKRLLSNQLFIVLVILSALFLLPAAGPRFGVAQAASAPFPVFDALLYKGKPDLTPAGLSPIRMVYASEIWNNGESRDNPNQAKIIAAAKTFKPNAVVCVDIENWPITGKPADVKNSIGKYAAVASLVKQTSPSVTVGFYGVLPIRDYWRAIGAKGEKKYDEWRRENAKLKPLTASVDVVFPSLYTFNADQQGWVTYAVKNLQEARKYGKPVYAFLWPEYHDSNLLLKGQCIPADFWRLQLETCRKYADGIVIWGGWQEQWDENAPWWVETKKFVQGL